MTEREAWISLNLLPRIGPVRVQELLKSFKRPEAIFEASPESLACIKGIGPKLAEQIAGCDLQNAVDEMVLAKRHGIQILHYSHEAYPKILKEQRDAPLVLYCKGDISCLQRASSCGLAVVGSRRVSNYGEKMTRKLISGACQRQWPVVSGLARGIDTIAHQSCLRHDGETIAILGGGLLQIYPDENIPLAEKIARQGGLLLSEMPLTMKPDKRTFPMRNRIIASLCPATLVVEAGYGSGSLITAEKAKAYKRLLFAVPGRADAPQSRGCNQLIKEGAKLVESLDDILNTFNVLPGLLAKNPPVQAGHKFKKVDLSDLEQEIYDFLEAGESDIEALQAKTGSSMSKLLTTLMTMELKRIIKQLPGKRFTLLETV